MAGMMEVVVLLHGRERSEKAIKRELIELLGLILEFLEPFARALFI